MSRALAAARTALGARFRLHGRDVAGGLDCVGLAALALEAEGFEAEVPSGYALRSGDPARARAVLAGAGLVEAAAARPGDLLLFRVSAGQLHLAIDSGDGIVHADAALGRVVERPGAAPWPLLGRWRVGER